MTETYQHDSPFHETDYRNRIHQLACHLKKREIDGALIVQNTDLYYFTGTIQQSYLYVPAEGDPVLMVRKDLNRAKAESPIRPIEPMDRPTDIPILLKKMGYEKPRRIGLECDVLPANLYFSYEKLFDGAKLLDMSHEIRLIRAVKSEKEIDCIRTAAHKADKLFEYITHCLKPGMTEIELAGKVEAYMRKLGHQGIVRMRMWGAEMFYGHLMAGKAAAMPSYLASPTGGQGVGASVGQGAGFRKIKAKEPLLVDYVFTHNGYLSDQTRIFAVKGLPDDLISAHNVMIQIQEAIKQAIKPGIKSGDLYDLSQREAKKPGF